MREQSDAGNRLEVVLGADVYREAMLQAYRIAAGFLFHMPTGVGYRIDEGEIPRVVPSGESLNRTSANKSVR